MESVHRMDVMNAMRRASKTLRENPSAFLKVVEDIYKHVYTIDKRNPILGYMHYFVQELDINETCPYTEINNIIIDLNAYLFNNINIPPVTYVGNMVCIFKPPSIYPSTLSLKQY